MKSLTSNPVAYQEYLIGKHLLNQKTAESIQSALGHFEKSIQEDPRFALPYTQIAYCYTLIGVAGYGGLPHDVVETKAKDAVMKALDLDSTLAEAHASLGYIKFRVDWDWEGAEKELKRAIELKPGYATAHEWYALLLGIRVKLDESLSEMKTAYNLDPLSPSVNNGLARVYHFRNEEDKALEQIRKTMELEPGFAEAHFTLGMSYIRLKDYKNAEKELKEAINSSRRPVMLGMLGRLYVLQGRLNDANALIDELQKPPMNNDKLYASSVIKFTEGKFDEAFAAFDKLVEEKYGIMIFMKVERGFFNSTDPRYDALLRKMRL